MIKILIFLLLTVVVENGASSITKDTEKPKVVFCPNNIIEETDHHSMRIFWKEPTYSDNCGKYPKCNLEIYSNVQSGSKFWVDRSPEIVHYVGKDPSGNRNEECKFTITLKKKVHKCPTPTAPINGAVVYNHHARVAQIYSRRGYYPDHPDRKVAFLYICMNGQWKDPSPFNSAKLPFPDFIARTPTDANTASILAVLSYQGDCNTLATKQSILSKYTAYTATGLSRGDTVIVCGQRQ